MQTRVGGLSAAGLALLLTLGACGEGPKQSEAPGEAPASVVASEEEAAEAALTPTLDESGADLAPDAILQRMATRLAATPSFSFHAEVDFDVRAAWGGLVQLAGAADFHVARPDRVSVDYRDDESARRLWLDGKTVTFLDPDGGFYAVRPQTGDIDATVDALRERFDLALPLGELISNDPSTFLRLTQGQGRYLGLHDADGVLCHHLSFALASTDLQLWIQKEGEPLPRRVLIVFREEPGFPRYDATLMDWKLGVTHEPAVFQAALPEGARRIEFLEARKDRP